MGRASEDAEWVGHRRILTGKEGKSGFWFEAFKGVGNLELRVHCYPQVEVGVDGGDIAGGEVDGGVGADNEGGTRNEISRAERFAAVEGDKLGRWSSEHYGTMVEQGRLGIGTEGGKRAEDGGCGRQRAGAG
jgi:hypothetical protein